MYRSLNTECLGITGRQSELLELALTHKFKGFDLDMEAFGRAVEKRGQEHATRCIASAQKSADLQIGTWVLPVRWQGDDAAFKEDILLLPALANVAKAIGASRCVTTVMAGSDTLSMKENFDYHTARFKDIADLLAPHEISLGLGFDATKPARAELAHEFVSTAESMLTLIEMVGADNVGLYLDTWNWHLGQGTLEQLAKLGPAKIIAARVADVPADVDADAVESTQRQMPSVDGVVPHVEILNKLHEIEFQGPVTPFPHLSQIQGISRDKMVQTAAEALRSVWPGAELQQEAEAEAEASGSSPASAPAAPAAPAPAASTETEVKADAAAEATPATS